MKIFFRGIAALLYLGFFWQGSKGSTDLYGGDIPAMRLHFGLSTICLAGGVSMLVLASRWDSRQDAGHEEIKAIDEELAKESILED